MPSTITVGLAHLLQIIIKYNIAMKGIEIEVQIFLGVGQLWGF